MYERTKEAVQKRRGSSAANRCDDLNSETAEVSGSVREDSVYSGDGSSTCGDNVDGGSSFEITVWMIIGDQLEIYAFGLSNLWQRRQTHSEL